MFGLSKLYASLIGGGVLLVVLTAGFFALRYHYIQVGQERQAAAIAAKDNAAIAIADKAKRKVQDCFDRGGEWNVEDGTCKEAKK